MGNMTGKIFNLLEYIGIRSKSYFHTLSPVLYDQEEPLKYYLDLSVRADYKGSFSDDGVPMITARGKTAHLPVHIALYALGNFEKYRNGDDNRRLLLCKRAGDWFVANQTESGAWLSPFRMRKFNIEPPYQSAMAQGLAMSFLLRAYHEIRDESYLASAVKAMEPFKKDIKDGGVTSFDDGCPFYEEYPAQPPRHVLNGFIYAMWGLYDMVRIIDSADARKLFDAGLETLIKWLPRFDTGHWSLYHIANNNGRKNPATVHYHTLHITQLDVMYLLTGEKIFKEHHDRWVLYSKNRFNAVRTLPAKITWDILGG